MKKYYPYIIVVIAAVILIALAQKPLHISSGAYLSAIHIYGEVMPMQPDGVNLSFKAGPVDIGSVLIKDGKYGYDSEFYLKVDDPNTPLKEGYSKGDKVAVYIEGIKIQEFSYFESLDIKKDFTILPSQSASVAEAVASKFSCVSNWECTEWGECENGQVKRICTDINQCKYAQGKPEESLGCGNPPLYEQPMTAEAQIDYTELWMYFGITSILMAVLVYVLSRKK